MSNIEPTRSLYEYTITIGNPILWRSRVKIYDVSVTRYGDKLIKYTDLNGEDGCIVTSNSMPFMVERIYIGQVDVNGNLVNERKY